MTTCEKIDLKSSNRRWKALPNMKKSRDSFNPCLFIGCVFLCGWGSELVDQFCPQTESFLPIELRLPEASPCCLYVHKNLLVVHSENYISKFTTGQAGQLISHSQVCSYASVNKRSNSQPVLDPALGLFYIFKGTVRILGMETGLEYT